MAKGVWRRSGNRIDYWLVCVLLFCGAALLASAALPRDVWLTALGVLIGGAITAFVSWYYYQQASNELRVEAEKLREYTDITLRMLQTMSGGGRVEVSRDERGNPEGVVHRVCLSDSISVSDHVERENEAGKA